MKLHSNAFDGLLSLLPEGDDTALLKKKTKNKKKKKPAKKADDNDDKKEVAKAVPQEKKQPAKTVTKTPAKEQAAPVKKAEKKSTKAPAKEQSAPVKKTEKKTVKAPATKIAKETIVAEEAKEDSADEASEKEESVPALPTKSDPKKLEELRLQLSSRIQEMREKRKAPGTTVKGAPKDRKTAVEARQQRKQKEKEKRALKRKRAETELDDEDDEESDEELADEITEDDNTVFSQVIFQDGGKASRDFKDVKVKKTKGPRDLVGQLKHIEAKKAKLESLDSEKRASIEIKTKWSRALALAEGEKVRDDEKLLRKAIKRQTKDKKKSAKTWKERQETVKKNIDDKQKKREGNIAAKRERNKLKSKKAKQKAGVIGRGRKPSKKRVKRN